MQTQEKVLEENTIPHLMEEMPAEWRACDACEGGKVKAWYFVTVFGSDLAYCAHHANKYELIILSNRPAEIGDFRDQIV